MQRVHVGGLFDGVQESDLKERFARFGEIGSIEIKSKTTVTGTPKVFAYVNIQTDESKLKKCFNLYNKTKWRGNELNLQLAKDSFMDRLHSEQKMAKEAQESETTEPVVATVDTSAEHQLVRDTVVKGAKPGTEVTDKKNWVVGKYGRVLPIVYLRRKDKKKIMKLDPSKYCHAVKKMDVKDDDLPERSVCDLSWELTNPDSEISKKRKGEFGDYTPKKKKHVFSKNTTPTEINVLASDSERAPVSKIPVIYNSDSEEEANSLDDSPSPGLNTSGKSVSNGNFTPIKEKVVTPSPKKSANKKNNKVKPTPKKTVSPVKKSQPTQGDNKDKSTSKPSTKQSLDQTKGRKLNKRQRRLLQKDNISESGNENGALTTDVLTSETMIVDKGGDGDYDSADTDEIIAVKKSRDTSEPTGNVEPGKIISVGTLTVDALADEYYGGLQECFSRARGYASDYESDCDVFDSLSKGKIKKLLKSKKADLIPISEDLHSSEEITIVKLDKEPTGKQGVKRTPEIQKKQPKQKVKVTVQPRLAAKESSDDDSSGTEDESSEEDTTIPPSMPTDKAETPKKHQKNVDQKKKLNDKECKSDHDSDAGPRSTSKETKHSKVKKNRDTNVELEIKDNDREDTSRSEKSKVGIIDKQRLDSEVDKQAASPCDRNTKDTKSTEKNEKKKKKKNPVGDKKNDKHKLSNQQRLESLKQRQEEAQNQKSAIQKALSAVDSKPANKKVVFDSESDDESKSSSHQEKSAKKDTSSGPRVHVAKAVSSSDSSSDDEGTSSSEEDEAVKAANESVPPVKKVTKKSGTHLFSGSSEDESSDDNDAFKVREEFEGKAGRKLMELQSKFSSDKRFKLDKRFIDDDEVADSESSKEGEEEDDAVREKEKSLEILASVVKGAKVKSDKKASFRDISTMRFDPTAEDHQRMEIMPDPEKLKETKKSKLKKKKKEKKKEPSDDPLPEVSSEKYYQVETNLKDIFEPKKEETFSLLSLFGNQSEGSGEAVVPKGQTTPAESKSPMPWQNNFEYDSSENEEMEFRQKKTDRDETTKADTNKIAKDSVMEESFFCLPGDSRILDGSKKFCRTEDLGDVRAKWLEKRDELVETYRKRRKQALRKNKGAQQQFKFNKKKRFGFKK